MPAKVNLTKRIGLALLSRPEISGGDHQEVYVWARAAIDGSDVRLWPSNKTWSKVGGIAFYRPRYGQGKLWNSIVRGVEQKVDEAHVLKLLHLLHAAHARGGLDDVTMKALRYRCTRLADMLKLDPITRLGLVL